MRLDVWSRARTLRFSLLVIAVAVPSRGLSLASTEAGERRPAAVASLSPISPPANPASGAVQKVASEGSARKQQRKRVLLPVRLGFGFRGGVPSLTPTLASGKARSELVNADTEPRYLKIFLLATPDNHRSPPLA
jgi:hypothetical protein